MNDLQLEEAIADLEGTAVHNCLAGGRSFPNYLTNNALCFQLMVKYSIELTPLFRGDWCASVITEYTYNEDPVINIQAVDCKPSKAILLAIIEAHKEL
jgi:hypothetical protein